MDKTTVEIKEILKSLEDSILIKKAALNSLVALKNEIELDLSRDTGLDTEQKEILEELLAAIGDCRRSVHQMENTVESLRLYTDYSGFYHWV